MSKYNSAYSFLEEPEVSSLKKKIKKKQTKPIKQYHRLPKHKQIANKPTHSGIDLPKEEKKCVLQIQHLLRKYLSGKKQKERKYILITSQLRKYLQTIRSEKIRQQMLIIGELIETEGKYISYLKLIIQLLKEIEAKKILTKLEIRSIDDGLEAIYKFNLLVLKELQACSNYWTKKTTIAQCFSEFIPYMGIYAPFINNYEQKFQQIEKLKKDNPKFGKFLTQVSKNPQSHGLRFESMIIMPVQRLPRYVLLLKELAKYKSGRERELCHEVANKMKITTSKINEKKRSFESIMEIIEIDRKFKGKTKVSLISPSRIFIAKLYTLFLLNKESKKAVLLLFNDLLLLAYVEGKSKRNRFKNEESFELKFAFKLTKIFNIQDVMPLNKKNKSKNSRSPTNKKITWRGKKKKSKWSFSCNDFLFKWITDNEDTDLEKAKDFIQILKKTIKSRREFIQSRRKSGTTNSKKDKKYNKYHSIELNSSFFHNNKEDNDNDNDNVDKKVLKDIRPLQSVNSVRVDEREIINDLKTDNLNNTKSVNNENGEENDNDNDNEAFIENWELIEPQNLIHQQEYHDLFQSLNSDQDIENDFLDFSSISKKTDDFIFYEGFHEISNNEIDTSIDFKIKKKHN
ncbi:faciogenital dysplasia protein [Anaeramoeba flamelloides]|uniref:Faciogenital dysplasia protein n=1 Tax=Anaeramoeba flamelloides TaxID=1746091 RepID=A0AAV7ZPD4_9EUKA|nr:faciogenital dysplasia protein [Anaeramoeba flamelloides]